MPALQSRLDHTKDPVAHQQYYRELAAELAALGLPLRHSLVDLDDFSRWRARYPEMERHYAQAGLQKCLEHYLTQQACGLAPGHVFLDIAASGSPWAALLRREGVEAHRLDMAYPAGRHGFDIGADATATGLPGGFAHAMALHCAFEHFEGPADGLFLREAARVLAPGGRLAIAPLYVEKVHFNCVQPSTNDDNHGQAEVDPGAVAALRDDGHSERFARFYSPHSLARRLFEGCPLDLELVFVSNIPELNQALAPCPIYCHFLLVGSKAR